MRILGIDYGRRRIGLALSDSSLSVATPFAVMENKGIKKNCAKIVEIVTQNDVGRIVLGLPLHTSGEESEMSCEVRTFGDALDTLGFPVEYADERWTTQTAEEALREQFGHNHKKVANSVDKVAASIILQMYLNERRNGR
jgi:putative Holliday junction resolvase